MEFTLVNNYLEFELEVPQNPADEYEVVFFNREDSGCHYNTTVYGSDYYGDIVRKLNVGTMDMIVVYACEDGERGEKLACWELDTPIVVERIDGQHPELTLTQDTTNPNYYEMAGTDEDYAYLIEAPFGTNGASDNVFQGAGAQGEIGFEVREDCTKIIVHALRAKSS
ncbi:MAG: hypothetical protein IIX00_03505, partial [Tidjanibacter sp.]|nr:hypothetical protein [Tidjanibacter sp.]